MQFRLVKDLCCNICAVLGRIGIHASYDNFQLAENAIRIVLIHTNNGQRTNTFPIKSHVFRIRLRYEHLVAVFNELAHGKRVIFNIASCKALICNINKWQKVSLLEKIKIENYQVPDQQSLRIPGNAYFHNS